MVQDNYAGMLDVSSALLKDGFRNRRHAFTDSVLALMGLGRYDEALALADERLKLLENDSDAYRDEDGNRSQPRQLCARRAAGRKSSPTWARKTPSC